MHLFEKESDELEPIQTVIQDSFQLKVPVFKYSLHHVFSIHTLKCCKLGIQQIIMWHSSTPCKSCLFTKFYRTTLQVWELKLSYDALS